MKASDISAAGFNPARTHYHCDHPKTPLGIVTDCKTCGTGPRAPFCGVGCEGYSVEPGIVLDLGAGGLGDACQGLWVAGGVAADNPGVPVHFRCGPVEQWLALFHTPGITVGRTERVHSESPVAGALQMNLGYNRERETRLAQPRWERYMQNVGAKRLVQPTLRNRESLLASGSQFAGAVALCPWSTGRWSEWSIHAWLDLESRLHKAGYKTVVLHSEVARCERFRGAKLIGKSPAVVAGAMLNAACVVGIDSGLAHLAGTLGVPVIVLGGATEVGQIFGCYPSARFVQGGLPCSGCFNLGSDVTNLCRDNCSNLHSIAPARVMAEVDRVVLHALVEGRSLVSEDRLAVIRDCVLATNPLPGAVAELGVYLGGTARLIGHFAPDAVLHLFDTFTGIPETDSEPGGHTAGDFPSDLETVRRYLGNPNAVFHPGCFPDTAPDDGTRFRFVHLDGDTYQTTAAALDYFGPRMVPGGRIVCDDYGWHKCPGVARALHERFDAERIRSIARYQAVVHF